MEMKYFDIEIELKLKLYYCNIRNCHPTFIWSVVRSLGVWHNRRLISSNFLIFVGISCWVSQDLFPPFERKRDSCRAVRVLQCVALEACREKEISTTIFRQQFLSFLL